MFVLLFITVNVYAGTEPITEVFGMKFGEELDTQFLRRWGTYQHTTIYSFTPLNPSKLFDEYIVGATPITNKIFLVMCKRTAKDVKKEFDIMKKILLDKYGKMDTPSLEFMTETTGKTVGDVTIAVQREDSFDEETITLFYQHETYSSMAQEETLANEVKKVDTNSF